jgi:hypothetical protein
MVNNFCFKRSGAQISKKIGWAHKLNKSATPRNDTKAKITYFWILLNLI